MELKLKLLDLVECAYRQEQIFVQSLSDEERSAASTLERWSAKDTIAHIAAWKERAAQVLVALQSGEPGPGFDGLNQFNARIFKEHQGLTWNDILDKSGQAYRFLWEQTEATPDDVLAAPEPSDQHNEPVWWFVVGAGYNHSLGHLAQYHIERGNATFALEIQRRAAGPLLQLDEGPDWQSLVHYGLAIYYAAAGQSERAIGALRRAFRLNSGLVERSKEDPRLAPIQEHPRYHSLCTGYEYRYEE
jgi:tetratricopeptide (TPR) repeat protein